MAFVSRRSEWLIRAVGPADAPAMAAFVDGLGDASRRLRFHGAVSCCSEALLRRLTEVDGLRHVALVAIAVTDDGLQRIVGEARYCLDADEPGDPAGRGAEFAISVAGQMQGRGLAGALMRALLVRARAAGVERLHGDVLQHNTRMAAFMRRHGFELDWLAGTEPGVERWERALRAGGSFGRAVLPAWLQVARLARLVASQRSKASGAIGRASR